MIRQYLVNWRVDKGLSSLQTAERAGMGPSYYHAIEHGERQRNMSYSTMTKLAQAFDMQVLDVVTAEANYIEQMKNSA